ncbi:carbohydrate ABC transporter permease [Streptomyces sporangiiformans]|uniref:Sugar ABC transporter permease n=1 Tax=Streptomyces sporangiiformans TaxID=2315329 RepID=A0A505DNE1_9ACTN|nr:sugar ABC transporter permease [Streptomyces sporangiiformans]TPQ21871.1 sugar ABC transporter permease [Streptomyces sporangiiformans]
MTTAKTDEVVTEPTAPEAPSDQRERDRMRRRAARRRGGGWWPYLFLAPWFVGLFGLTIYPMLDSLYLSFTDFDLLSPAKWVGAQNYSRMFHDDPKFWGSVSVTTLYVVVSVPLKLALALAVAVLLNRPLRGLGFYRAAFYLPSLLGGAVAIAIMWRQLFGGDGLFNDFLGWFGIKGQDWISNPDTSVYTLILLAVWQFGTPMVIFLAGLKQLPQDVYEAAAIDGAGVLTRFFRITLPLLTPIVFFNVVLQIIGAFQTFTPAYVVSNGTGGPLDSTMLYSLYLYKKGFTDLEMGYASALAWVLFLVIAVFTAINFIASRYWVHYDD